MRKAAGVLATVVTVLVPVAAWPGLGDPFVTPRLVVLAAGTAIVALLLAGARMPPPAVTSDAGVALLWLAVLGFSAVFAPVVSLATLLWELLVAAWAVVLAWTAPPWRWLGAALRVAAGVVAAWAVLQWMGVDPWSLAGWAPAREYGPRMRVYASLGNPNYVGAFLAAVLPLSAAAPVAGSRRLRPWAEVVLVAAGIAATGSRGAWLGAAAGTAWLVLAARPRDRSALIGAGGLLLVLGSAILLGPARGLTDTLRGRMYIWRVAGPHLLAHPVTGWGPGSFEVVYPQWEVVRMERGVDEDVRRYATAQRHAHNDYVERLSDLGVPGLLVWGLLIGWVLARPGRYAAGKDGATRGTAAAAGIAALAAVSLVDFPMQRAVERFTWWTLAVLAARGGTADSDSREASR